MNKWILFLFFSFTVSIVARAELPTGDASTDTNPLMTTPQRCSCEIRADNKASVTSPDDNGRAEAPAKYRQTFNLKNDEPANGNPNTVNDSNNGAG